MKNRKMINLISRVGMLISGAALLTANAMAVESKPRKLGGTEVNAVITGSLGYGDNVFRSSVDEQSSSFFAINPIVEAVRATMDQRFSVSYEGNGVAFFDSSDDNYLSNKISTEFARKLNAISEFSVGASYEDGSTVRGIGITEGSNDNLEGATEFTRKDLSLGYIVGSEKIGPSLELSYDYTDMEFDNFEIINQGRDYKLDTVSARLGYQYSVATKFFVDLSYSDFDYKVASNSLGGELDNSEQAVMVGVKWRMSRLSSGEISVGSIDKDFDNFQDSGSLTSWNAEFNWTPTSRDTITVESFARPFEQAGTGLFQDVQQTSFTWLHGISKTINVSVGATFGSVDFETVERDDDFELLSLGLTYQPNKYSEWSLTYEHEDKDSNISRFDYDTNTVLLSYSVGI